MSAVDTHADYETIGRAFDRTLLRRLMPFTRPYAARFAAGLFLLFAITGLEVLLPWMIKRAIDGPTRAGMAADVTEKGRHVAELVPWAAAFLGAALLAMWVRYVQFYVLTDAGQRVLHDVRAALFRKLQRLPVAYYDRTPVGRLVTRVTSDVETLNELFTSGAVTLIGDVVKIAVVMTVLFVIDARLGAIAATSIPLLAVSSAFFRVRARRAYRETRTAIARVTAYLGEAIAGIPVLQAFAREDKAQANFARRNHEYLLTNLKTVLYFALFFPVVDFLAIGVQGGVFWGGGVALAGATLTIGEFLWFWVLLGYVFEPLRELAEKYNVLQSAMASAERIFTVLDTAESPPDPPGALTADAIAGRIEFQDVTFAYRPGEPVLDGVSFTVEPGATVALVGATGGGKTTITALLSRFYEPASGSILVDGAPIERFDRASLRRKVAYVPQDVYLFTGTVLDNLSLGLGPDVDPRAAEQRVRTAARAIGAEAFIERLPGGYGHVLAERGSNLSAGERQIIAFVRALATDPAVLMLDEATANVDPATEELIQRAIPRLLSGRTSLVIAHRLSTVKRADRILVLHHGRIRESGTHAELLRKGALYARLYRLQFKGTEAPGRVVGDV